MSKVYCYMIAVLTILLALSTHQNVLYKNLSYQLLWAADTLYLNVNKNREMWKACEFRGNNT